MPISRKCVPEKSKQIPIAIGNQQPVPFEDGVKQAEV
jgi:hypothetical protein